MEKYRKRRIENQCPECVHTSNDCEQNPDQYNECPDFLSQNEYDTDTQSLCLECARDNCKEKEKHGTYVACPDFLSIKYIQFLKKIKSQCSTPDHSSTLSPDHYSRLTPEPFEVIRSWKLDYFKGCAIKYIARAGHKKECSEEEDLRKAIRFLELYLDR